MSEEKFKALQPKPCTALGKQHLESCNQPIGKTELRFISQCLNSFEEHHLHSSPFSSFLQIDATPKEVAGQRRRLFINLQFIACA